MEMEVDARHVPVLSQQLGLDSKSRTVVSSGIGPEERRGNELDENRQHQCETGLYVA